MNISFDEKFLKTLRQKLTIGNTRSVHLNSLPGRYATRLDLYNLVDVKNGLPDLFINTLLEKQRFKFEISLNHIDTQKLNEEERNKINLVAKRLNSLYYDNNDNYLEFGIKTFGFGFPLLIRRDKQNSSSIIAAPLLVWNLDIQKSGNIANKWIISRDDDFPISINEVLISHIQKDENVNLNRLDTSFLQDAIIDRDELVTICNSIFSQLGIEADHSFTTVEKCVKDKSDLKDLTQDKPWILWSGIFGLFRSQKESIIKEIDLLLSKPDLLHPDNLINEKFTTASLSAVETDPSQIGILNSLRTESNIVIQGPPGCGKSQSITALISNALIENKKCLIVCEKKTALDVIQSNLEKIGLDEFCVIIDDVYKDRQALVKDIRQRVDTNSEHSFRINLSFQRYLNEINAYREQINKNHLVLDEAIFGDNNWTKVVALFLKNSRNADKSHLDKLLKNSEFKFSYDEYTKIDSLLSKAEHLIKPLGGFNNPLFELSDSRIKQEQSFITTKMEIESLLETAESVNKKLQNYINEYQMSYGKYLDKTFTEINSSFRRNIISIIEEIKLYINQSSLFNEHSFIAKTKLNIFSLFSTKFKNIKKKKQLIRLDYNNLINKIAKLDLFAFKIDGKNEVIDYNEIQSDLNLLLNKLKSWWDKYPTEKQRFENDLIMLQFPKAIDYLNQTNEFVKNITTSFYEINDLSLFKAKFDISRPISIDNITFKVNKSIHLVQSVSGNISLIRDYVSWNEFLGGLSPHEQSVVHRLLGFNTSGIRNYFRSWYLFWLLAMYESDKPRTDREISELRIAEENLKVEQIQTILTHWREKQAKAINRLKNKGIPIQTLYNLKGSAGKKRNSLRKIISTDFNFFTDFFPILLINPVACSSIIPLKIGLFDFVLFDEASQLRLEDTFTSLIRGKYKIVSGDRHQMPPSNYFGTKVSLDELSDSKPDEEENTYSQEEITLSLADSESLLMFAESAAFRSSSLDIHYRSRNPHLINFSNSAFYGSRLIPMPPLDDSKSIRYFDVHGTYENQKGVNPTEAAKVVEIILSHIDDFVTGKFKSVGVATLNMYQRNLILEMISERIQKDDKLASIIGNMAAAKNFFVKNLENIQGDEKDIIIMSTTFGITESGSFIQNFGPINQEKGYKLLNVIITRAKYKFYVVSSIPASYYFRYQEEIKSRGNVGKGIFYAYLAYARSIEEDNIEQTNNILNLLSQNCSEKYRRYDEFVESPFEQEVVDYLYEKVEPKRIEIQYKCGGFKIDIVVKPKLKGQQAIAIECDGASYHSSPEAYAWDLFRQKQLEEHGFIFYRIWSANWWENPERETKKLLDFIENFDQMVLKN